jgi:hypothetical protein
VKQVVQNALARLAPAQPAPEAPKTGGKTSKGKKQ